MVGLSWRMFREALMHDGDLYQFHHPDLILAGLLLKLSGKKVIYDSREYFPDKILSMRWIPVWMRRVISAVFSRYEWLAGALCDAILVADRYSTREFRHLPVSVVPNYPLLVPVQPAHNQSGTRKLIYVGGLSDERGLGIMLRIAELLRDRNVELQLMGPCHYPGDEARIRSAPGVTYFGNQNLSAVYQRLSEADLGLMLLQPVPAYHYAGENTLKLFEYMWCGLPLVSSDFPNLKRIIDTAQCGICIDPCDAEKVASAIAALLDQPDVCRRMGSNGRNAVLQAYNWPAAWKVVSQVYRNVLSGNRSPVEAPPLWNGESVAAVSRGTGQAA
jgi:glycosyltransferase involved in cell wall biosynthesis